jgi:hypothetical protein
VIDGQELDRVGRSGLTYPQSDLASLEEFKTHEGSSRKVVHGSLSVRWSPETLHPAVLFEVVFGLRNE